MTLTDPLVLPAGVLLLPVTELAPHIREQIQAEDGDFALTRPQSRTPSKVIDAESALLLKGFEKPSTIAQAVFSYSKQRGVKAQEMLDEAFPMLMNLVQAQLLVPADSEEAREIQTSFQPGDLIAGCEVASCVQSLDDSELFRVKTAEGATAAMKILRAAEAPHLAPMLEREAALLRQLDGSVNPKLLGEGSHEGRRFLLIEWCPGLDSSQAAEAFRRQEEESGRKRLWALCRSILASYAHLHEQGVIHSDVHPRNVIVSGEGLAKIIDYGLARREGAPQPGGSPHRGGVAFFFEPEYANAIRSGQHPPASSLKGEQFGVGAMLYSLLTGLHYVDFSVEREEMLRQIAEEEPAPFAARGLTPWPEAESILAKALHKNPDERFASLAEMAARWSQMTVPEGPPQDGPEVVEKLGARVLERVALPGSGLSFEATDAPTTSVNYGTAGIAYALYRVACVRGDAASLSSADVWAARSGRNLGHPAAFFNPELDVTPETVGRISPFHSPSGIHFVQALIAHAMGDIAGRQFAMDAFVAASKLPCESLDITLGRCGTLLACSLLLDAFSGEHAIDPSGLIALGDETLNVVWQRLDSYPPIPECVQMDYLGAAHGWAGLLYATLLWSRYTGRSIPGAMAGRLRELAACGEPAGRGIRWKWQHGKTAQQPGGGYMPGWCNGSAGYVFLWTAAHEAFAAPEFLNLAERAAWNAWETDSPVVNLCCGLGGQAYSLLNLYKHTGALEWLERAKSLAIRAARRANASTARPRSDYERLALRPESLYKGELGLLLLLTDLESPQSACMPLFEPEGWQAMPRRRAQIETRSARLPPA